MTAYRSALIVGAGDGLSASLARAFHREGMTVSLAARNIDKLSDLSAALDAPAFRCDVSQIDNVQQLFSSVDATGGAPDVVVYNPSFRTQGSLVNLDPADVERAITVTAFGAFLVSQQAVRRMVQKHYGAVLFTGASASIKGYSQSAPFAMGKFALRGLAQSMARELAPQNIHVAHFVIDGAIRTPGVQEPPDKPDSLLDPDAIALSYLNVLKQPRSAWTWEMELRPWVERF
jgi:NAD(P)-dependent dehydrogenase (short-subunit alcohol dehydrogenase family)